MDKKVEWHRIKPTIDIYAKQYIMLKEFVNKYGAFDSTYYKPEKETKNGLELSDSFITRFQGGHLFFFTYLNDNDEKYFIAIQSSEDAKILNLTDKYEFQTELKNLKYNISEQLDDVTGYINKLLEF